MQNRVRSAWRSLRGRRIFSLAAVGGIAALLLGTLGASTAVAHGMVTSAEIENQTIQSVDIGAGGVGQSEIRQGAVDASEIEDQSIRSWDIGAEHVGTSELRNGSVRNEDLNDEVQTGPPQGAWFSGEDETTELAPADRTTVGTLEAGSGSHLVIAQATVSSTQDNDNLLCFLGTEENPELSVANARALREAFALTAVIEGSPVQLQCQADAGGTATDVSITAVRVNTGN